MALNVTATNHFSEFVGSFDVLVYTAELIKEMKETSPLTDGYMWAGFYNHNDIYAPYMSVNPITIEDLPHAHTSLRSRRMAFLYKECLQYNEFILLPTQPDLNIRRPFYGGYKIIRTDPVKKAGIVYRWDFEKSVWVDQFDAEEFNKWKIEKDEKRKFYNRIKKEFIKSGFDFKNQKAKDMSNMLLLLNTFEGDKLDPFKAKNALKYKAWSHLENCGIKYEFGLYLDDVHEVLRLYLKKNNYTVNNNLVTLGERQTSNMCDSVDLNTLEKLKRIL